MRPMLLDRCSPFVIVSVVVLTMFASALRAADDTVFDPWDPIRQTYGDATLKVRDQLVAEYGTAMRRSFGGGPAVDAALLSQRLFDEAQNLKSNKAAFTMRCQYAYELGKRHRDGFATALQALEQLDKLMPKHAHWWNVRLLYVLETWYDDLPGDSKPSFRPRLIQTLVTMGHERTAARDDVTASRYYSKALRLARQTGPHVAEAIEGIWKASNDRANTVKKVEAYEQRLVSNPGDSQASDALVKLYVVDLDDPARAIDVVKHSTDRKAQQYVPLAAQPVNDLKAEQAEELSTWYTTLAADARESSKADMELRATLYHKRYLALGGGKEPTNIDDAIAALSALSDPTKKPKPFEPKPIDVEKLVATSPDNVYLPPPPRRWKVSGDEPESSGRSAGFFGIPTN